MKGGTNAQILVGNGTLKIQGSGTDASTFTANDTSDVTLNIKGSGATTVTKSAANEITVSSTDQSVSSVSNHYSPTGTTSKDASGGTLTDIANSANGTQVVTGVSIDVAGHVTGVKSVALKATNNTYTVNNGTLSIQGNGTTASSFTANQSGNTTLNIKGSGATSVSRTAANEITISSTDTNTWPTNTSQLTNDSIRGWIHVWSGNETSDGVDLAWTTYTSYTEVMILVKSNNSDLGEGSMIWPITRGTSGNRVISLGDDGTSNSYTATIGIYSDHVRTIDMGYKMALTGVYVR